MSETRPYVAWELINHFMIDVFKAYGVPEADAAICADVLLESDRRGIESHGCNRFKPIYLDRIKNGTLLPVTNYEIVKETPTTVVMDAHNGMGMVASHKMMEMLIEKAKVYGTAGGTIFNSTHYQAAVKIVGGEQYILSAVMHADERNRAMSEALGEVVYHYHLHVVYIPVVEKQILWSKRCKDKSLIGTVKETIMQVSSSKKWAFEAYL